jgi:hypothetical protein
VAGPRRVRTRCEPVGAAQNRRNGRACEQMSPYPCPCRADRSRGPARVGRTLFDGAAVIGAERGTGRAEVAGRRPVGPHGGAPRNADTCRRSRRVSSPPPLLFEACTVPVRGRPLSGGDRTGFGSGPRARAVGARTVEVALAVHVRAAGSVRLGRHRSSVRRPRTGTCRRRSAASPSRDRRRSSAETSRSPPGPTRAGGHDCRAASIQGVAVPEVLKPQYTYGCRAHYSAGAGFSWHLTSWQSSPRWRVRSGKSTYLGSSAQSPAEGAQRGSRGTSGRREAPEVQGSYETWG